MPPVGNVLHKVRMPQPRQATAQISDAMQRGAAAGWINIAKTMNAGGAEITMAVTLFMRLT